MISPVLLRKTWRGMTDTERLLVMIQVERGDHRRNVIISFCLGAVCAGLTFAIFHTEISHMWYGF